MVALLHKRPIDLAAETGRPAAGAGSSPDRPILSIIVPVRDEQERIASFLEPLQRWTDTEILVAIDSMNHDESATLAGGFPGVVVLEKAGVGRGAVLAAGARAARGRLLLFLHADCRIEEAAVREAAAHLDDRTIACAFRMRLDSARWIYRVIEIGVGLRSLLLQLPYGDQGLLLTREIYELTGGFRSIPRCEDLDLVLRLRRLGRIGLSSGPCVASSRRWEREGALRVTVSNLSTLARFLVTGATPHADQATRHRVDPDTGPSSVGGAPSVEAARAAPLEPVYQSYGTLLSRYVTPAGVRYADWRAKPADVKALSDIVTRLSTADVTPLSPSDRFALYINLYNAKVLEIVLTKNPRTSIKEVTPGLTGYGVFLKPVLRLGKDKLSLNQLEERLREESKDPRVHFAVNCASRSCPPIAAEPYRGERLNDQLDHSTRSFLASPGALMLHLEEGAGDKETVVVQASKIFDWYEKDFKAVGGPLAFIEKYGPASATDALKRAGSTAKLKHLDYDWSLNTAS